MTEFKKYPKINAPFMRDMEAPGRFKPLIRGYFATPEIAALAGCEWEVSEKVDGTNTRILWNSMTGETTFGGRTDRAQLPAPLVAELQRIFTPATLDPLGFETAPVVFYGEGFGGRIQAAGPKYRPAGEVEFILFDVRVGHFWLQRWDVLDVAVKLGLECVPFLPNMTLNEAIEYVKTRPKSFLGDLPMEGVVLRAPYGILDRAGHRIMTKVKCRDFCEEEGEE